MTGHAFAAVAVVAVACTAAAGIILADDGTLELRVVQGPTVTLVANQQGSAIATCPDGFTAVGGGWHADAGYPRTFTVRTPNVGITVWNGVGFPIRIDATAVCLKGATT